MAASPREEGWGEVGGGIIKIIIIIIICGRVWKKRGVGVSKADESKTVLTQTHLKCTRVSPHGNKPTYSSHDLDG